MDQNEEFLLEDFRGVRPGDVFALTSSDAGAIIVVREITHEIKVEIFYNLRSKKPGRVYILGVSSWNKWVRAGMERLDVDLGERTAMSEKKATDHFYSAPFDDILAEEDNLYTEFKNDPHHMNDIWASRKARLVDQLLSQSHITTDS